MCLAEDRDNDLAHSTPGLVAFQDFLTTVSDYLVGAIKRVIRTKA
jgi:hypothetical protein